jgi:hypothetical protein
MPTSGSVTASDATPITIPDVVAWFRYLNQHEERNKDGIVFAPYGVALKAFVFLNLPWSLFSSKICRSGLGSRSVLLFDYAVCQRRSGSSKVTKMGISK